MLLRYSKRRSAVRQPEMQPVVTTSALHPYLGYVEKGFPQHRAALRKERGFTQQTLAERVGVHVVQLRRYEGSHPTLDGKNVARSMLDGMILRHEARRWASSGSETK